MSNIVKIGRFADGQTRIRVVTAGNNADPAPADTTQIIYDSDWPEVVHTLPGYYGSQVVTYTSDANSSSTSADVNISWTTLAYTPMGISAEPGPLDLATTLNTTYSSTYIRNLTANAYLIFNTQYWSASGFTYSPADVLGVGANANYTYTMAWWVLLLDTSLLGNTAAPARTGSASNFMKLDKNGPVVAKPGANIGSTNPDDYLIAPLSMSQMLGQPMLADTVTSLPTAGTNYVTYYPVSRTSIEYYEYIAIIPHNLGYRPFVLLTNGGNVDSSYQESATVLVDDTNLYLYASSGTNASSISITPISYFIFRQKWF